MTPEELVAATSAQINSLGAIYYFHPDTIAHGKEALGLDGMRFYFIGRAGVLGDVEAPVVTAAFGYFAPAVVAKMWNSSKEKVAPRDAAAAAGRGRRGSVFDPALDLEDDAQHARQRRRRPD